LWQVFYDLNYSTRKEYARGVREAKAEETRKRRVEKVIEELRG
jgi:uncharacterized protein YdeI (YjbR/CyaY-like superfamily)